MTTDKCKILIVDDNPKNIQVVANILNNEGYSIAYATSGKDAIYKANHTIYDIILLDILMPEIDGYETAKLIKKHNDYKDTPIIFVSAKDSNEDIVKGFQSGGVDYVTKPYKSAELLARINTHLNIKKLRDELIISNKKLEELNDNLEIKIAHAVENIQAKDKLLQERTKLVQMGEMLNMIAHQWRQPLASISIALAILKEKMNSNKYDLNNDEGKKRFVNLIENKTSDISDFVQFLSATIDDFRNFFKPDKDKTLLSISYCVEKSLQIIQGSMKHNSITIDTDFQNDLSLYMYQNEMIQVILNILKNSEDNFIEKNIKDRKITISTIEKDGYSIITICDNGGGMDDDIINNIFDPYFSTKSEKNGTGLGLYMSKIIVEKHHNGHLSVTNTSNGVCFEIKLQH